MWKTIGTALACVLLFLHTICLLFMRSRSLWLKLPIIVSHCASCMVYGVFVILVILLQPHIELVQNIKVFYIGSLVPFYGSVILLTDRIHHNRSREQERKIVLVTWALYFIWILLVYILTFQYQMEMRDVIKNGKHYITIIGLGAVAMTLLYLVAISSCLHKEKTRNNAKEKRREITKMERANRKSNLLAKWIISVLLISFELVPKITLLLLSNSSFEWMLLCRLWQRLVNGVICISFFRSISDQASLLSRRKKEEEGVNSESEEMANCKKKEESTHNEEEHWENKMESDLVYKRILVVVTDEDENVREKTLFGRVSHFKTTTESMQGCKV